MWESLTGSPAGFGPVLRVAVSPDSRLCPPGWVGIVVIADAADDHRNLPSFDH
jgi:hypothetical protein